jgi:ornithine cyclodeaminase/alanine dehydrogenase-like protein (mu-crystallin family)
MDLAQLLDVAAVIETVQAAFAAYTSGATVTPLRVGVEPPGADGVLLAMPCAIADPPALGTKVVSVFRGNPARGLPTVTSIYLLSDSQTGAPLAVMDGTYLTALRTAAGSAVATRYLARPDASSLGVFGTGVQARFHVLAIRQVRPITHVLVAATSAEKAEAFGRWVTETTGLPAAAATHTGAAAADVLAVGTTSPTPVVPEGAVRPGAHVNAVGAFTPTTRELPSELLERALVYVDTRAGALSEAGDLLIAAREGGFTTDAVIGEVGELVLGRVPARTDARAVTIYKSVGAAFLDAATARLAYQQALATGRGQAFSFADW